MKNSRRKLLKALTLCGSATTVAKLPATWSSPVVKSVVLPAHAAATTCVIRVELDVVTTGNYGGGGGFGLWDNSECHFADGDAAPVSIHESFPQLGPGTYYLSGGVGWGGSEGAGAGRIAVTCCDQMEEASDSSAEISSRNINLYLVIVIGNDGTCSISRRGPNGLPQTNCV